MGLFKPEGLGKGRCGTTFFKNRRYLCRDFPAGGILSCLCRVLHELRAIGVANTE